VSPPGPNCPEGATLPPVAPYWKSKKKTRPEGKFIGCTDMNSLVDKEPNTLRTNGKATPAQVSPCPAANEQPLHSLQKPLHD